MKDLTTVRARAEAIQNIVEVLQKCVHMLPKHEQEKASATCARVRRLRVELLT